MFFKSNSAISRFKKQIAVSVIVLCAGAIAYIQSANFPFVPFTDAICFLPQAVMYAQGGGLRNVYQFNYLPDGGFIWHGFLFPMLLGGFFKTDTYLKVSVAIAVLNAANILILAAALLRFTTKWRLFPRSFFLLVALLTQVGFLQGLLGRPESLSSLLLAAGILIWSFNPNLALYFLLGCITGLLAVTSPLPAIYSSAFFMVGMVCREKNKGSLLKALLLVAVGALLAIGLSLLFYPYSFNQWIWGMRQHAGNVIKNPDGNDIILIARQFFISSGRFMMGLVFSSCLIAGGYLVWRRTQEHRIFGMLIVIFVAIVGFFIFWVSLKIQHYYILCMFPIAIGCAGTFLGDCDTFLKNPLNLCIYASLTFAALDPVLLQVGSLLGFRSLPLAEARRMFASDFEKMPGRVAVSMDLAVLTDRTERLQVLYDYVPKCDEPETDWLVVQQYCFFFDEPPSYDEFYLVEDRFVANARLPGRWAQWFGVNGYGYAIYKRKTTKTGAPGLQ